MKKSTKRIVKKVILIICFILIMNVVCCIPCERPTFADSGFSTSYDSGGSSSWDSGSSWSSGSSSWDYDSDYSGGSSSLESIIGSIIVTIIITIIVSAASSNNKQTNIKPKNIFDETAIENEIKKYIPDFNKEEFLTEGYNIYCDVQKAWMDFKLEDVRDIITDELYSMYESQLATLEVKGEQNIMKDFVLNRSFLKDVVNQNDTITITTGYIIEFYDYIAEKETGKVLRGTDQKKMKVTYEMKFRKTLNQDKKVEKCPNCGAEIDMNSAEVCKFCHTKLVTEHTKWVLTEKITKNQETI